jgi:eukaryotic-like serine/threonine-protein kinase
LIGVMLRVRYEVLQEISSGPIFTLYAARDHVQSRDVAVRVLKAPFNSEANLVAKLSEVVETVKGIQHPGIERLYELDDHEGTPFVVGEVPKGAPLIERMRKLGAFSVPVSVATAISTCEALEAVHSIGLVHGDVGPHNITTTADGVVKLQLPGVWQVYSASQTAGAMALPSMVPYLAPEVSAGAMPTPASDVYAAGVMLFELLTGRQPYLGDTSVAVAMKHATAPTPTARLFNAAVPVVLDEIVKKAMSKDPAQRYPSAGVMLSDLRVLQDSLRFGKPATWPKQEEPAPASVQTVTPEAPAPAPVALKVPKVETTTVRDPKPFEEERERGDVPAWLKVAIAFFSAVVLSMIGFWLVFNLNRGKQVLVPNLIKMNVADARNRLQDVNLNLRVSRETTSETFPADTIIQMDPPANDKIPEGGEVSVVVSAGSKFVSVPDVRGMTIDDAKAALQKYKLELDESKIRRVPNRSIAEGLIVDQFPDADSKLQRNSSVRVNVSSGRSRGDPDSDPLADERYAYTLTIKTSDIDEPVTVRVVMTDARSSTTVHEEMHEPEEEFTVTAEGYGSEVTFRIFYDGVPVKQIVQHPSDGDRR